MNFYQIEYFITLAETLNYTKASQKLHITQPNLSKMIINLEHSIGSQLFIRSKRDVKLTAAGKVFYQEIKKTMKSYENALNKTRDMENGTTGVINLGFLGTALMNLLPGILNKFSELYPKIKINPIDYTYSPLIEAMMAEDVDMGILPDLEINMIPGVLKKSFFADDMCVVVHQSHRFAKRDSVKLTEIRDEPFIHMDPKCSIRDYNLVNNMCLKEDFLPNTVYEASTILNMIMMTDCQIGVTILAGHMNKFAGDHICFIPIEGFEKYFNVSCVWRENANICVPKLLDVIDCYMDC